MILKRNMSLEDKGFYSNVVRLVMPMAIQNLINVGVTSTDVIMLGKVGETALSGVSLANQVYFILSLLFFGLTSGACVLTAQYWGKKDTRTIEKVMGMSFRISLLGAAVFTVAALAFPGLLMRIFTADKAVIEAGISYLRIVAFSYMLSAFTNVYLNIIRSVEKVVIATVVYGTSLVANVIFNAIFIFGLLGVPAMGAAGAALGTLLARVIEVLIVVFYAVKMNDVVKIHIKDLFVKDKALGKDFFTYAFPVLLNELAWGAGMAAISAIVGHLGSSVVAAHSVAQVCRQLSMVIGFGISNAAAIMIGKAIGEKKEELARQYGKRFVKIAVICGIGGETSDTVHLSSGKKPVESDPSGKELSHCNDADYVLLRCGTVSQYNYDCGNFPCRGRYQVWAYFRCECYVAVFHCRSSHWSICHWNPHALDLYSAVQ